MNRKPTQILARLVRRFGLLVLLTLLGATAGGIYGTVKTPTYLAQAYVVVTGEPGEPFTAVNFAQAYGRIATAGPVVDAAATALGSRQGLAQVTATTSPDAPVIEITATGTDAKRTAEVANAVAKALADYATSRKAQTRVTANVLAPADTPSSPSSPKPPLELAVGAAAGLLVGGLAALAGVGRTRREQTPNTAADALAGRDVMANNQLRPAMAAVPIPARTAGGPLPGYQPPMAIAWYGGALPSDYLQPSNETIAVHAQHPIEPEKVVGRAVVIHREPS